MRHVTAGWVLVACVTAGAADAQTVQLLSPDITFTASEVFFRDPVTYVGPSGAPATTRQALKLVLRGQNFYDGATGPRYYLGAVRADAHYTAPDGRTVAVYFYDLRRVPRAAPLRIETHVDRFVTLRQTFTVDRVRWLPAAVRRRHDLPDPRVR
jgi:hypothetical protein